jgi:hypothetical protein
MDVHGKNCTYNISIICVYIYIFAIIRIYEYHSHLFNRAVVARPDTLLGFGEGLNPLGSFGMTLGNRIYWDRTMSYGGFLKWWYPQIVNL